MEEPKSDDTKKTKSLLDITSKFIAFLQTTNGAEVELSEIEKQIDTPKRRLYDVINVLVVLGIIERGEKSKIRWIGNDTPEEKIIDEPTLEELQEYEKSLDEKNTAISNSFPKVLSNPQLRPYSYVPCTEFHLAQDPNIEQYVLFGSSETQIELLETGERGNVQLSGYAESGKVNLIRLNAPPDPK